MRTFVILCSVLISTAYAGSIGYSYGSGSGSSFGGGLGGSQGFGSGLSLGGQSVGGPSYSLSGLPLGAGLGGGQGFGGQGVAGPSYSSSGLSFGGGVSGGQVGGLSLGGQGVVGPSYSAPAPAETIKEFYSYSAPEYEFNDIGDSSQIANSLKKNLRVIFIKGPENTGLENAALQLAKSAVNERTAIYVLNKQADVGDLANKLQSLNNRNSLKPEVHFVKYRTSADADNAQRTIQSQYDSLEGPTSSISGGVAPVLDFASKPVSVPVAQESYAAGPVGNVESSYLPPNKRA